jgi:hypothetical protein
LSGVRFNDDLTVDVTTVVTQPFALEVGGGVIVVQIPVIVNAKSGPS